MAGSRGAGVAAMTRTRLASVAALVGAGLVSLQAGGQQPAPQPAPAAHAGGAQPVLRHLSQREAEDRRPDARARCDLDRVGADAETWEKVVRKVRAGLMPPAGARRPDARRSTRLAAAVETARSTAPPPRNPNPGRAPLHRMNRVEYANAIRDLLALDVDAVDAAAGRRFEPRLRQHRRRARRVAVAARALRRRRRRRSAGWPSASREAAPAQSHLHRQGRSQSEPARSTASRSARAAAPSSATTSRSTASTRSSCRC